MRASTTMVAFWYSASTDSYMGYEPWYSTVSVPPHAASATAASTATTIVRTRFMTLLRGA